VQEVTRDGDLVQVTTRGDANDATEVWAVPADRQVGVVVASVPLAGLPLTAVRTSAGWALLVGVAVIAVIVVLFRPRRRDDDGPTENEVLSRGGELPMGTATISTGERP
jgi:hypothetical protein